MEFRPQGKIIIIEGASGSGRDSTVNRLAQEANMKVVRGVHSITNPSHNEELVPEATRALSNAVLNPFELIMQRRKRDQSGGAYLRCASLQFKEAIRLSNEGHSVIMDKSIFTLIAYFFTINEVAVEIENTQLQRWVQGCIDRTKTEAVKMLGSVSGILVMRRPKVGSIWEQKFSNVELIRASGNLIAPITQQIADIKGVRFELADINEERGKMVLPTAWKLFT